MIEIILSVAGLALVVLIYFAGVSRRSFNAKQDRIEKIADEYHKELSINSHLKECLYPKLLLNAGVLSIEKESEMIKVLKIIERRHMKSPFISYPGIKFKNAKTFLVEWQSRKNKGE